MDGFRFALAVWCTAYGERTAAARRALATGQPISEAERASLISGRRLARRLFLALIPGVTP